VNLTDYQVLYIHRRAYQFLIVVLSSSIGNGRSQRLLYDPCRTTWQILQNRKRLFDWFAPDEINDLPDLRRRNSYVPLYRSSFHGLLLSTERPWSAH
jgi:hypothetical protein